MLDLFANVQIFGVVYSIVMGLAICVVGLSIIRLADRIELTLCYHEELKRKELAAKEMEIRLFGTVVAAHSYIEKLEGQIAHTAELVREKRISMTQNNDTDVPLTYVLTHRPIPNTKPFKYWVKLEGQDSGSLPHWYTQTWLGRREYVVWSATPIGAANRLMASLGSLGISFTAI